MRHIHPSVEKPPALSVSEITKSYGDRRVLDQVSIAVEAGERVALMGPSGSGKSTLLNCVGGIDRPDTGEIRIGGERIDLLDGDSLARLRRRVVTTVFQFFHLLPTLSARENVTFPLRLLGVPERECRDRVDALLSAVRIDHRADAYPDELSGGEMQRVAIARALAPEPALILADEPTGNLDSATGETILDLLESLGEVHGHALLLVTHSERATRICHRVLRLRDGRLTGSGGELS